MTTQTATLMAAAVAAVASLISLLVTSKLVARREKRHEVFQSELKRLIEVEELAGRLTETFSAYLGLEDLNQRASELLPAVQVAAGRLRRYPPICQALRDLHNAAGRILRARRLGEEDSSGKADLESAFQRLLEASDAVVKPRSA